MTTRRSVVLEELDAWRAEGAVSEAEHARLRAHVESSTAARLDAPLGDGGGAGAHVPREERASFAVNAMQFVGGLLLGAALIALVFFLDLQDASAGWAMLAFGVVGVGAGAAVQFMLPGRDGLAEALFAAGLVPLAVAAFPAPDTMIVGLFAMAVAAGAYVLRRGDGPSVVVAGAAYVAASFAALGPRFFEAATVGPYVWWLAILAFAGLMFVWRDRAWTSAGFAFYVGALVVSFVLVLDEWGVESSTAIELFVGAYLAVFLVAGVALGVKGLVAGSAAGLTIDAVIFAAELGGPGTAVVVLLILGGLLVWQAEFLRSYFRRPA